MRAAQFDGLCGLREIAASCAVGESSKVWYFVYKAGSFNDIFSSLGYIIGRTMWKQWGGKPQNLSLTVADVDEITDHRLREEAGVTPANSRRDTCSQPPSV